MKFNVTSDLIVFDKTNLPPEMASFKADMHRRMNMGFAREYFLRSSLMDYGKAECVFCGHISSRNEIDIHYTTKHQKYVQRMFRTATLNGFVPCPNERIFRRLRGDPAPFFLCCQEVTWGQEVSALGAGSMMRLFMGQLMVQDWFIQADNAFERLREIDFRNRKTQDEVYELLYTGYRHSIARAEASEDLLAAIAIIGMIAQEVGRGRR